MTLHIIFTESEILLSKKNYSSWRDIQNEYNDYKASLGPWSVEEITNWLTEEYSGLEPKAEMQTSAFINSAYQITNVTFRES